MEGYICSRCSYTIQTYTTAMTNDCMPVLKADESASAAAAELIFISCRERDNIDQALSPEACPLRGKRLRIRGFRIFCAVNRHAHESGYKGSSRMRSSLMDIVGFKETSTRKQRPLFNPMAASPSREPLALDA